MEVKRFNERRAEEERAKAEAAECAEARSHHNILADIFAARAAARESRAPPNDG
jgi:hypothetical protein